MDQELERAALVALLRRGDRSWPDLTDQIETVGSALEVLENALDASGQGALFDTGPSANLDEVAAEIAAWEREGMRLVTILDEDYPSISDWYTSVRRSCSCAVILPKRTCGSLWSEPVPPAPRVSPTLVRSRVALPSVASPW